MEVNYRNSFDRQCRQFSFCFTCEHCAHFDDLSEVCLHGFPNQMHRRAYYETVPRPLKILFCKEFDLA